MTSEMLASISDPVKIELSTSNLDLLQDSFGAPPGLCLKAAGPPGVHTAVQQITKFPVGFRPPPGLEMFGPVGSCPPGVFTLEKTPSESCAASTGLPSSAHSQVDSDDEILEICDDEEQKKTVVMRNIPNQYTRDMLLELIDQNGFAGSYSLVYLPMDFATGMAVGYAFINFIEHNDAVRFQDTFQGFKNWAFRGSSKVCEIAWRDGEDDLQEQVARFRNCPMMHPSVPDDFRPALFMAGKRIAFPPPTQSIRKPRIRSRRA